jgi:hypothetical protein
MASFNTDHARYPDMRSPDYPWDAAPDCNEDAPEEGWTGWVFVWDASAWQYFGYLEGWEDGVPFVCLPALEGWAEATAVPRTHLLKEGMGRTVRPACDTGTVRGTP